MSIRSQTIKGRVQNPDFILLHGVDGVGKTTLASQMPELLLLESEDGSSELDVERAKAPTFSHAVKVLKSLVNDPEGIKSLAIDSTDHLEQKMYAEICADQKVTNIALAYGGYGKGFDEALRRWVEFVELVKMLREKHRVNILAIAHSQIKTFTDPILNAQYDRYVVKMNEKSASYWRESAETVLFQNFRTYTAEDKKLRDTIAFAGKTSVLHTMRTPAYDAKNRFGLPQEIDIEPTNGWAKFQEFKAIGRPEDPAILKKEINLMLDMFPKDNETRVKAEAHLKSIGDNVASLKASRDKLRTLTQQK